MIHRCSRLGLGLLFVCWGTGLILAAPDSAEVTAAVGPVPAWVKPIVTPGPLEPGAENSGTAYLLVDRQENLERSTSFYHEVRAITSENGVQNGASISVSFDPAFETLTFHDLRLIRDGAPVDRLDRSRIRLSPNAKNADRLLYDSTWSAEVALDDVRVGDLIEYSYSREGSNPLQRGHVSSTYSMQWDVPIARSALRIIYPTAQKVQFRGLNGTPHPMVTTANGLTKLNYESNKVPPRAVEDNVPEGHAPRQRIEISDFQNWREVVQWALPFSTSEAVPSPDLAGEIDKLRSIADPAQRVVAALQFLQNEVRDVNFAASVWNHPLTSPNEIMRRRAGDDKDKAHLLVALLRGAGFDAAPALVSDFYRGQTPERLPSPEVFDHIIVEVRVGDATHWVDPWRSAQRGPLGQIYVARYLYALVVRSKSDALTSFVAPQESWPVKKIVETYRVPRPEESGELDVVSDYHGLAADQVRSTFRESTREEMQKRYLDYYARTFPEIKTRRLLWYEELPSEDGCRVSEWYSIPHPWQLSEDKNRYVLSLNPGDILAALGSPATGQRRDPLRQSYPSTVKQEINIEMFEEWPLDVKTTTIATKFFRLEDQPNSDGSHLQLNYTYELLRDRIEPGEYSDYITAVSQAKDSLGYTFRYSTPAQLKKSRPPSTFNWANGAAGLCFLLSTSYLAFRYFRASKLPGDRPPPLNAEWEGIGGWLSLLAIAQVLRPIGYLFVGYQLLPTMLRTDRWRSLTDPIEAGYHSWWAPTLLFELFFNTASLVFCLLIIALFFLKRAPWPRCFALFLFANLFGAAFDLFLTHQVPDAAAESLWTSLRGIVGVGLAVVVWVPYVLLSKRVKATFRR